MLSLRSVLLLAALAASLTVPARAAIAVGDPFPALAQATLTGGGVPSTDGKVVVVDFWASWCAPCKASFAALGRLHQEFAERGLVIVAVSVDENRSAFQAAVKKWQPAFPAVLDDSQKLVQAVQVPTMPTSYVIGKDGRVRHIHQGFHGAATEAEWRKHIAALLAETSTNGGSQ